MCRGASFIQARETTELTKALRRLTRSVPDIFLAQPSGSRRQRLERRAQHDGPGSVLSKYLLRSGQRPETAPEEDSSGRTSAGPASPGEDARDSGPGQTLGTAEGARTWARRPPRQIEPFVTAPDE